MAALSRSSSRSFPRFAMHGLAQVGGGAAQAHGLAAWITVGEGIEVVGLLPRGDGGRPLEIASLAGHATLDAATPDELAVFDLLRPCRQGGIAADELLGLAGLVKIHRAVCRLRGVPAQRLDAAQILAKALAARCAECSRAVSLACGLLGDVAARIALTLGAHGGVYLGGDFVVALGDWFDRSPFRRRFEAQGRDREVLRAIPTFAAVGPARTRGAAPGARRAAALDVAEPPGSLREPAPPERRWAGRGMACLVERPARESANGAC